MANYLRRIVSGKKARFKDANLDLELDLVYVTDRIIIMGYPATGIEGIYRNRREDAKKFLEHRHGKDFWIFNFCPINENSYPSSFFEGRVSRYPFPDHHSPPLAILPLAAREIREWLTGSPERVAVLHCKAGKGRSGTLACAYLLSLDEPLSPPKLKRNMTKKEWAKLRADRIMDTVETEEMPDDAITPGANNSPQDASHSLLQTDNETQDIPFQDGAALGEADTSPSTPQKSLDPVSELVGEEVGQAPSSQRQSIKLEDVIALHTSRRMKGPSKSGQKLKQGVSIPSQRRWLYYWSLVLTHVSPPGFWGVVSPSGDPQSPVTLPDVKDSPKVRLRQITVRMRELSGVKKGLLKVANTLLEHSGSSKQSDGLGAGLLWASVARYDDELVENLERWESHTRDKSDGSTEAKHFNMGKRRPDSVMLGEENVRDIFKDSRWDKSKMVRSFARVGEVASSKTKEETGNGSILTHTLKPLSDKKWAAIEKSIAEASPVVGGTRRTGDSVEAEPKGLDATVSAASSTSAIGHAPNASNGVEDGIVLNAEREVRVKLHIGRVFIGWFWFIPTFHMPHPIPKTASEKIASTHFKLTRKEVDFPVGIGSHLIDVDVELEWIARGERSVSVVELPAIDLDPEDVDDGEEGGGLSSAIAAIQVVAEGGGLPESVETAEAAAQ